MEELNIIIIYHSDMDGIASAYIIQEWYTKYSDYSVNFKFIEAGSYDKQFDFNEIVGGHRNDVLVYIVDYSVNPKDMEKIVELVGVDSVIWIDHHISAIKKYQNFHIKVPGLRVSTDLCGAELTYLYLYEGLRFEKGKPYSYKAYKSMIPAVLKRVGNWDVHREPNSDDIQFKMWFETYIRYSKRSNKIIVHDHEVYDKLSWGLMQLDEDDVYDLIESMRRAYDWNSVRNEDFIKAYGEQVKLYRTPLEHYKVIALNMPSAISSRVFESVKKDYEIGMLWHAKNGKYTYSIFRLDANPEKFINLADIAQSYGGGGHHGAAGFIRKSPLF